MDAISFILGVQTSALRSSTLKDLIYRGFRESKDPADSPKSAQVTAYYQLDNGNELKLTRT
jgi:structural maintenance of chromosome 1